MNPTRAQQLIETLPLQPHPEGGWYRVLSDEVWIYSRAFRTAPRQASTSQISR